jgi:pimeloyl-ACP methyl ester carboxylesterase
MMHSYFMLLLLALAACSASMPQAQTAVQHDAATHQVGFVQHQGARLHYLEWMRKGSVLVLYPGYSLTAHAFDEVATRLADTYRVIAITPRGFGESDAPDASAYTATLVSDLRAVLDSLRIPRATLVGHSLGGSVVARFALEHPQRVDRLIFLDAFPYFAEEGGDSIHALSPVETPPFSGDTTYARIAAYLAEYWFVPWSPALDADLRAKPLGRESARREQVTAGYIEDHKAAPPDVSRLTVPALQLCADLTAATEYPWLPRTSADFVRANHYVEQTLRPFQRRLCERFAATVPHGRVQWIQGSHYVFFTDPAQTASAIREYVK